MDCREFKDAVVGDDPAERVAAERHAADCSACAELLDGEAGLLDAIARWKADAPAPPAWLEHRIAAALPAKEVASSRPAGRRHAWMWMAAAAAVVLFGALALLEWRSLPGAAPSGSVDLERVARDVERLHDEYVAAIGLLEVRASAVLAAADDTALPPERVDILNAYRGRLVHLDAVIADVEDFLDLHAGHAGGHTVLLAALQEKNQLLQEVLDLPTGEPS